jgi:hypothetical protein
VPRDWRTVSALGWATVGEESGFWRQRRWGRKTAGLRRGVGRGHGWFRDFGLDTVQNPLWGFSVLDVESWKGRKRLTGGSTAGSEWQRTRGLDARGSGD